MHGRLPSWHIQPSIRVDMPPLYGHDGPSAYLLKINSNLNSSNSSAGMAARHAPRYRTDPEVLMMQHELTPLSLFLQAGLVGKGVIVVLLLLLSIWCWVLIVEATRLSMSTQNWV
jgi:hypothetical protein